MSGSLTPHEFVNQWRGTPLSERSSYQAHFNDVCHLVGHEPPGGQGIDAAGKAFLFERAVKKDSGATGFADVFYEGHFAIEYKAPGKYPDLDAAYQQLLQYRERLNNPPLLVVTDIETWQIHTNWPNTEKRIYSFSHEDIANRPSVVQQLRDMFEAPQRLHPRRNTEQVTQDAAKVFELIANNMRDWEAAPDRIAHFLTKLVFCLFAEDVALLPAGPRGESGIFSEIIEQTRHDPLRFVRYTEELFRAMADGGEVMFADIPYFNGSLFDDVVVEELSLEALTELEKAARLNWQSVEPAIFGTLFERSLDPDKRSQLGAHYTSREDILLIVEPVLMQPLRREWEAIITEAEPVRDKYEAALLTSNRRTITTHQNTLLALREGILKPLREITVLDPACGSGNFLYVSLQLLMAMEKEVITHPLFEGLPLAIPEVHPRQMYGIEINPIAHALTSIVVWIGYIQWQKDNGYVSLTAREPILEELYGNIVCKDAILEFSPPPGPLPDSQGGGERFPSEQSGYSNQDPFPSPHGGEGLGEGIEPDWPAVDVIVSNPPFLGGSLMRGELGDDYVDALRGYYEGRVPGFADLVCYWFEKARAQIENGKAKRAGLLATNSIRGGANREVLKHIKETGDLFMAWADREWVLEGAAVRVSMVGFDDGDEQTKVLDNVPVISINSDLTATVDITTAHHLPRNESICFMGASPKGPFDIEEALAKSMIEADPKNSDIVRPVASAIDIVQQSRSKWTIDFGILPIEQSSQYSQPFEYVQEHVYPIRSKNRRAAYAEKWWQYAEARPGMRQALEGKVRFIATPAVAKHRIFVWMQPEVLCNQGILVFAREDDYFFGVLHSTLHEVWSLRMGTSLEDRPRYTPTTTFETFPFPWLPGQEDTTSPAYQRISRAAQHLHQERDAWLFPHIPPQSPHGDGGRSAPLPDAQGGGERFPSPRRGEGLGEGIKRPASGDKDRTLTNLYNALNVFRGKESIRVKAAAGDFAPRLDQLHTELDQAVCDAYGWDYAVLDDEEEILRRLLALNLNRAGNDV